MTISELPLHPGSDRTRAVPVDSAPDVLSLGPARLLAGSRRDHRVDHDQHATLHPSAPALGRDDLADLVGSVGLVGRGGAAFPVERKLRATAVGPSTRVVVNGSESEPASLKDRTLMRHVPHLVIDGALVVARALGTNGITLTVHDVSSARSLAAARAERLDATAVSIDESLAPFVGGEARSVVNRLSGLPAVPGGRRVIPSESGVGGHPTFLSNIETFAQLGWLASHGPSDFRSTGTLVEPGTTLMTILGDVDHPGVVEAPHGTRLDQLTGRPGSTILLGGYHGTWTTDDGLLVDRPQLASRGTTWGAGVVAVLPDVTCSLGEVARVARWLAQQSAGQCGPCAFGLPSVADDVEQLLHGETAALERLRRRLGLLSGRGACAHPDGSSRFLGTALEVMADEVHAHASGHGCGRPTLGVLPIDGAAS